MKQPKRPEDQGLTSKKTQNSEHLDPDHLKRLYKKQLQGAFVWSGSILFLWVFLYVSFVFKVVDINVILSGSICAVLLILMNISLLWVFKRTTRRWTYEFLSILLNALQIIGQTVFIYFLGGLRGTYMILIYAGLITYVGVVASRRFPFIVASFCAGSFSFMVILEHLDIIPHQNLISAYHFNWTNIILILVMFTSSILVVAFTTSYTGGLLKKARDRARESERLKSQFLANMSHEIRTPMNAVIGFTDMLLDTDLDEEQTDYARTTKSSGQALVSLINDILDLSKIEAGELDFEEIDFDPELLAYDVCDITRPRTGKKPIEILCRIGDNFPSQVKGDPLRLRQVLTNLMGNAAKFTQSGEIELSLDIEEERDDRVKLHAMIRDTGIGIREDRLLGIFTPFEQADGSTTRKYGGTGLGLSISKQISNLMGGDLWAESEVGKGSVFHFTGWLGKAEDKEAKRVVPVSLSGKKALIVDDNQTNLNVLTNVLELVGMRVVALINPEEVVLALQEAVEAEDPFDICISDIQMPDMSGYDLGEQIRGSQHQFSNIPLIALSSSMERDAKKCKEAGFDGFLGKPIHREKLFRMMEMILGEREEEGEKEEVAREKIMTQYSVREDMKHSVSILLAEDNPVNQKLGKMMLTKAGYEVEVANDGNEAVEKFTSSPDGFDLIFMDVQMPEMNGLEATAKIREKELELATRNPELGTRNSQPATRIPIIAMTAAAMKGDREKCLDAGMNDYIPKPIKRELVFEIIEKWVFKGTGVPD